MSQQQNQTILGWDELLKQQQVLEAAILMIERRLAEIKNDFMVRQTNIKMAIAKYQTEQSQKFKELTDHLLAISPDGPVK